MRVRIDESRQDNAARGIDDFGVVRHLSFDLIRRPDRNDRRHRPAFRRFE